MAHSRAQQIVSQLQDYGVEEVVVCSGSRNAELVRALIDAFPTEKCHFHFEERSASFFALGRMRALGKPVLVCTTSGTAAVELYPACVEAFYTSQSLIFLTADRPLRFRGSGAPQSIDQAHLYSGYASFFEYGAEKTPSDLAHFLSSESEKVKHINVPFEEPFSDSALGDELPKSAAIAELRKPLLLVSGLDSERQRRSVSETLSDLRGGVVYLEVLSGITPGEVNSGSVVQVADAFLRLSQFDGVIRIGDVPLCRLWRDLEQSDLPVINITDKPFTGLGRSSCSLSFEEGLAQLGSSSFYDRQAYVQELGKRSRDALDEVFERYPMSEHALVAALLEMIAPESNVYLGNSLPIRIWQAVSRESSWSGRVAANRGANGIDGQISSFFGFCRAGESNLMLLGDLTCMYDLAAPGILRDGMKNVGFTLFVLNNRGGRIFEHLPYFSERFSESERTGFVNQHRFAFEAFASSWGLKYSQGVPKDLPSHRERHLIELQPDNQQTLAAADLIRAKASS